MNADDVIDDDDTSRRTIGAMIVLPRVMIFLLFDAGSYLRPERRIVLMMILKMKTVESDIFRWMKNDDDVVVMMIRKILTNKKRKRKAGGVDASDRRPSAALLVP